MKEIIKTYLEKAYTDLQQELKLIDSCELSGFTYEDGRVPDYNKPIINQCYIMKYFPAYLAEYYYIYRELTYDNFNQYIQEYNVVSCGCGCGVDLLGLYLKRQKKTSFKYLGIDYSDWKYRDLILKETNNIRFVKANIGEYNFNNNADLNVLIFPKSICEFPEAVFNELLRNLSSVTFQSNRIAVIISGMNRGYQYDYIRFMNVINIFLEKGYKVVDIPKDNSGKEISGMVCINELRHGINTVVSDFEYPNDLIQKFKSLQTICLSNKECSNDHCLFTQSPILTTNNWSFSWRILERDSNDS